MPQIIYPSAQEVPGPWWLDRRALEELDAAFEKNRQNGDSTGDETQARLSVEVEFDDQGRTTAESFKAMRVHPEQSKHIAVGFRAQYKVGRVVAVVEARNFEKGKNPLRSPEEDGGASLVIQVVPESSLRSRQLFGDLQLWAKRAAPPKRELFFERY